MSNATRPHTPPSICCIESAARLLIHARNSHGALRNIIRAAIHADINLLRRMRHG